MLCDWNIERYVRKNHYDDLNRLSPMLRFAEKFRWETELLEIDFAPDDEIAGWFRFAERCDDRVVFSDETENSESEKIMTAPEEFGSRTCVDRGHTLINYETILKHGLAFYESKLENELEKHPNDECLSAMKSSLDSALSFVNRVQKAAQAKLSSCSVHEKPHLTTICDMLKKVPYHGAEGFREAVQAVWIIHFLAPLAENAWCSISLGRFDSYMYPFYKNSVDGGMTRAEAKSILCNFYRLLNSYADGACLLNIGPEYNALSELIAECQKELSLPAPILGARIDDDTPDEIWDLLLDEKLFSMGQPTFYGEKSCISALTEKGLKIDEAKGFSNNSCMGISIPGAEFNSMWGCVFSVSSALEAAVNCGRPLAAEKTIVPEISEPKSLDALFENFEKCAEYMLKICAASYEERARVSEKLFPDAFLSLLTRDCIEKRRDRISGAKYHNITVECMGSVNASDGICAIDNLVFQKGKYSLAELTEAVKNNFEGFEDIASDIASCPKFGENAAADDYAVRLTEILARLIRTFSHENMYYSPSLHTLDTNVAYGREHGAGYDGRRAGEPFAKNAGASNSARTADPTSMALSAARLPQHAFFGGQPIDVNFAADTVKNHKKEIRSLISVYLEKGGLQFQVNSLSSAILKDASDNPGKYPYLVVRIGGYSIYFDKIAKSTQKEFIERVEKEGA